MLTLLAERSLAELPEPDIVLVPGGPGEVAARAGGDVLEWLRAAARDEHLDDIGVHRLADPRRRRAARRAAARPATGWRSSELRRLGAEPVAERVVFDGKLVTAAGVSAGIDMALALAERIAGDEVAQAIQLGIEYDPQPPFDAGSPDEGARRRSSSCCAGASRFEADAERRSPQVR